MDYTEFFKLEEQLKQMPGYIPSPRMFNVDPQHLLRETMDRMAMPLPDGTPSPFSSRNPFTVEGLLMGQVIFLFTLYAYEGNLIPDYTLFQWFRIWGIELGEAEYPRILLRFYRQEPKGGYYEGNAYIPVGTEVINRKDNSLIAVTTEYREIPPVPPYYVDIPARLNRKGKLPANVDVKDFSYLPNSITYITGVEGVEVLDPGRDAESLASAVNRLRQTMQMPGGLVVDRHYYMTALNLGAEKALVLPGVQKLDDQGKYADLVTVIVYPPAIANYLEEKMTPLDLSGTRIEVHGAELIPLVGSIDCLVDPAANNSAILTSAAMAIDKYISPPSGNWGDKNFAANLAGALVRESPEIYGVSNVNLFHSESGLSLSEIQKSIQPWQLFKLEDTVRFNWLKS